MRDLAQRLIPVYQDADPDRYLANLSALQMVAGDYSAGYESRQSLGDRRRKADLNRSVDRGIIYDVYARAKSRESEDKIAFVAAFTNAFREALSRLDDQNAFAVTQWLKDSPRGFKDTLQKSFDQDRSKERIEQADAVTLIWTYNAYNAYRSAGPLVGPLVAEDDGRRYSFEGNVVIKTPDGADIAAVVVRPKNAAAPLPTLFEFTLHDSPSDAKECAAHGYVGVTAYVRGLANGPRRAAPFEHDGDDARIVIGWIAAQSWSDGRVGMYGDGYGGFTPWAAAKRLPPALKAIAVSASLAPGVGTPMQGSIFTNSAYRWSFHLTSSKASDKSRFADEAQWRALDQKWYRSGRAYRELGRVYGRHNPIFIRWLNHPSYDRYWQKMIPYREQFARIDIPVLTTTGYYGVNEPGDLYYFTQHHHFNAHADHTLLIGPYEDGAMRHGPTAALRGYQLDPVAVADLHDIRYQWFDHVFKGTPTPALLKDTVNYEVMGTNEWQHAPSIEAMSDQSLKLYLDSGTSGAVDRLTGKKGAKASFIDQTVSLTNRADAAWTAPAALVVKSLTPHDSVTFASEPLAQPVEFSGLFSARLDFTVNKMDMDLAIALYELCANGDYVRLFAPGEAFRASYVRDRAHRHLLKAGERQTLTFNSEHLTSRRLQAGSRLVLVLGINKRSDQEINYGSGNDVSVESMSDGRTPIRIKVAYR